jgi:hypothetical protein
MVLLLGQQKKKKKEHDDVNVCRPPFHETLFHGLFRLFRPSRDRDPRNSKWSSQ